MMNFSKIIFLTVLVCVKLPAQGLEFLNGKKSVDDVANRFPAFGKITNFTGTLIDSSWVLTCEHCGGGEGTELEINGQKHKVDKKITHPLRSLDLARGGSTDRYDLALLHLEKPVTNLKPVRRYRGTLDDLKGKVAWVLGRTSQGRSPNLEAGTSFLKKSNPINSNFINKDFLTRNPDHTSYEAVQIPGDSGSAVFMNIQNPMSQIPPQNESDFYNNFALIGIYTGGYSNHPLIASLCRPEVNNWIDNTIIAWALGQKEEAGAWVISLSKPKLEDAPSGLLGVAADIAGEKSIVALIDSSWLLVNNDDESIYYGTVLKKDATIELDHQLYKIQNVEPYPQSIGISLIQLDRPYLGAKPIERARITGEEYKKGYPIFYWSNLGQLQKADQENREIIKIGPFNNVEFFGSKIKIMWPSWVLSKTNEEFSLAGFGLVHWNDPNSDRFDAIFFTEKFNSWIDNTIIKYALKQK